MSKETKQAHDLNPNTGGKVAYMAYREAADKKSAVTGCRLPEWDDMSDEIKRLWEIAAAAVVEAIARDRTRWEIGTYNAGYRAGKKAWEDAEPENQENEPPENLTEGMNAMKRDGFQDGWGDKMVGM